MFRNYLKTAFRSLLKNKAFSMINIFGLAIGLSACLIIFQYVNFHTSFDDFHTKKDRIYRLNTQFLQNGENTGPVGQATPALLAPALAAEQSYVDNFVRLWTISYMNNSLIYKGDGGIISYDEPKVFLADRQLFDVFEVPVTAGNIERFEDPYTLVLSESSARKYFGNEDPIGKKITLSGNIGDQDFEVVALMDDLPENTHLDFSVLLSFSSYKKFNYKNDLDWGTNGISTYFLMEDGLNVTQALSDISALYMKHNGEKKDRPTFIVDFGLEPIQAIHMGEATPGDFKVGVDSLIVYSMALIAMIILAIAWINYLNLSLVKTLERTREIGVRTVMGSNKRQITSMFMIEALLVNFIAFIIAVTLSQLGAPFIQELGDFQMNVLSGYEIMGALFLVLVMGSVISGLYPTLIIKAFNTADILMGRKTDKVSGIGLRKVLVAFQFIVSFILVAGTMTVYQQVSYMKSADLGIDINDIMVIKAPPTDITKGDSIGNLSYNSFKTGLKQFPFIEKFANAGEVPGMPIGWGSSSIRIKNRPIEESMRASFISMGQDFHDFFDIKLLAGRYYQRGDDPFTRGDVVINRKMAEKLGFNNPEEALGVKLDGFYNKDGITVRGVVENHHHTSLHSDFDPIVYILSSWTEFYFVKFNINADLPKEEQLAQFKAAISSVENKWDEVYPTNVIDYYFLDQSFNAQYGEDERFGKVFTAFALLAIFIACLGLFGLFSFALQQRVKEIGIRKVLGADTMNLIGLLTRHYMIIIVVAYIISVPIYWTLAGKWLENYTFKIELGPMLVVYPLIIVFMITFLTMLLRMVSSLRANPIDSLRYE